jgi:AcrR family transcriptional regulator
MTRRDIIIAALNVWGRELYLTTSLSSLARELGVSKTAFYRHFKNKQALLDAMEEYFFDDYFAFIRVFYDRAWAEKDIRDGLLNIVRGMLEYYARNRNIFLFSLIRFYGGGAMDIMKDAMSRRGINLDRFTRIQEKLRVYPPLMQLLIATLTFSMTVFHKRDYSGGCPEEEAIREIVSLTEDRLVRGLGLDSGLADTLDYPRLEGLVLEESLEIDAGDDSLLKAVAAVVAEAGPWNATMDMVAQRSGLSKSGLYAHFENKKDMLRQFFMTEFDRILKFAEEGGRLSEVPGERLYLIIIRLGYYLQRRTEILLAMDWIRIRRFDLGLGPLPRISRIFSAIRFDGGPALTGNTGHWILFLIVTILLRRPGGLNLAAVPSVDVPKEAFRALFRFISAGIDGFKF